MNRTSLHPKVQARLQRYTTEHTNHYGVVPAAPDESVKSLEQHGQRVDAAMIALGRLSASPADGIMRFLRSRILSRQEALSSSGMEGTQSTLDAILGLDSDSDADAQARQVRSYAMALDELIPKAKKIGPAIFTPKLFQELHQRVMAGMRDYKDVPGALRETVVWIGPAGSDISYSTWNPPGPEHLEDCLAQTARYMQGNGNYVVSQPLLQRIAIAHAHFEAVHPFLDGNGRVGRLLIPLMLVAEGHEPIYISPWIEANKGAYYSGLKAAQQQLDPAPLTGAIAEAIIETEAELKASEQALGQLDAIWREKAQRDGVKLRRNSSADRILSILTWLPVLSVKTASAALSVTAKAAGDGIDKLCDHGILREITGQQRNRVFEAPDVMRVITRPFGSKPILPGEEIEPDDPEEAGWPV